MRSPRVWVSFLVGVVLVVSHAMPTFAATWYILPDGSGDAPTIQDAIDLASPGDVVLVAAGTYTDQRERDLRHANVFHKAGVTLVSESGPAVTIIDGGNTARCFFFIDADDAVVEGFTITNGLMLTPGENAGTMHIRDSDRIRLTGNVFESNRTDGEGGAIFIRDSDDVKIEDNVFHNNTGGHGGGMYARFCENLAITGNRFEGNVATTAGGGGASVYSSSSLISNNEFVENQVQWALGVGGGLQVQDGSATSILNNLFVRNRSVKSSAGLGLIRVTSIVENNTFVRHEVDEVVGSSTISIQDGDAELRRNLVVFGIKGLGAISCSDAPVTLFECNDVWANEASNYSTCGAQGGANGNISKNPVFCDYHADDFELADSSPCLPGNHPNGDPCGTIGARGPGSCQPTETEPVSWGTLKGVWK